MADFAERARRGITRCSDADLPDLRAFQALNYGSRADESATAHLDWLCTTNPYRAPEGLGIWIARRNGRIVGQQAEIGFGLRVGNEQVRAAIPTELMVEPTWRLRGIGPALTDAMCEASRVVCAFLMTDDATRMYQRGGWADLGEIPRYVLPLGPPRSRATGFGARRRARLWPWSRQARAWPHSSGPRPRGSFSSTSSTRGRTPSGNGMRARTRCWRAARPGICAGDSTAAPTRTCTGASI